MGTQIEGLSAKTVQCGSRSHRARANAAVTGRLQRDNIVSRLPVLEKSNKLVYVDDAPPRISICDQREPVPQAGLKLLCIIQPWFVQSFNG